MKKKKEDKRMISFQVPAELLKALDEEASKQYRTRSSLIVVTLMDKFGAGLPKK